MTLNDLERQNKGFYGLFGDFGLRRKAIEALYARYIYHSQGGATQLALVAWRIW